jgi:hypothetical protein
MLNSAPITLWLLGSFSIALVACSSDTSESGTGASGGDTFIAEVNGKSWSAEPISISSRAGSVPGGIIVVGSGEIDGVNTSLTISLGNIRGPGTFALGVSSSVYGGTGQVGESTGSGGDALSWITENTGVAGTIVLTRVDTRIVGTFEYLAEPGRHNETGTNRQVTHGEIDLPLAGTLPAVAENLGSKVSAKLNGETYNAWSVDASYFVPSGTTGFRIDTSTKEHGLSLYLEGVGTTGTYTLSNNNPTRRLTAGHTGGDASHCCWDADSVGTVTVTKLTPARIQGTFTATFQPREGKPATLPLEVTDGTFDVGVQ